MTTYKLTAKNGQRVILSTCDTFTLARGKERLETTPSDLADWFSKRSLQALLRKTTDPAEETKLRHAIEHAY